MEPLELIVIGFVVIVVAIYIVFTIDITKLEKRVDKLEEKYDKKRTYQNYL